MVLNYSLPIFFARFSRAVGNVLNMKVMYRNPKIVYSGYIAGYQYHKGAQMEHLFKQGTEFLLKAEPQNPFDNDAVAVYYDNARIGFIPPDTNADIAKRIQQGEPLKARVTRIEPQSDPWERVYVEVLQEEAEQDVAY